MASIMEEIDTLVEPVVNDLMTKLDGQYSDTTDKDYELKKTFFTEMQESLKSAFGIGNTVDVLEAHSFGAMDEQKEQADKMQSLEKSGGNNSEELRLFRVVIEMYDFYIKALRTAIHESSVVMENLKRELGIEVGERTHTHH